MSAATRFDSQSLLAREVLEELSAEPRTAQFLSDALGAPPVQIDLALSTLSSADRVQRDGLGTWSVVR